MKRTYLALVKKFGNVARVIILGGACYALAQLIFGYVFVLPEEMLAIDASNAMRVMLTGSHPVSARSISGNTLVSPNLPIFQDILSAINVPLRERQVIDYGIRLLIGCISILWLSRILGSSTKYSCLAVVFFASSFVTLSSVEYWPRYFSVVGAIMTVNLVTTAISQQWSLLSQLTSGTLLAIVLLGVSANPASMLTYWLWPLIFIVVAGSSQYRNRNIWNSLKVSFVLASPVLASHCVVIFTHYLQPRTLAAVAEWKSEGVFFAPPSGFVKTALGNGYWGERAGNGGIPYFPWYAGSAEYLDRVRVILLVVAATSTAVLLITQRLWGYQEPRRQQFRTLDRNGFLIVSMTGMLVLASSTGSWIFGELSNYFQPALLFREPWTKFTFIYWCLLSVLLPRIATQFSSEMYEHAVREIIRKTCVTSLMALLVGMPLINLWGYVTSISESTTKASNESVVALGARLWSKEDLEVLKTQIDLITQFQRDQPSVHLCLDMRAALPSSRVFISLAEVLFSQPLYAEWTENQGDNPQNSFSKCSFEARKNVYVQWDPNYVLSDNAVSVMDFYLDAGAYVTGAEQLRMDQVMRDLSNRRLNSDVAFAALENIKSGTSESRPPSSRCIYTYELQKIELFDALERPICIVGP